ncbi:restriction endonuclease subunit S [bacterium]|nr:restriction endonuclease subunit S [bacterium]
MSVVLSEHLPLLASAPEGVKRIRNLILGLAISGRLVPQDAGDQDASVAFERHRISRDAAREVLLRKFSIPNTWLWCEVGDLCVLRTGATPSTLKAENFGGDIRWLVSGDIHKKEIFDCDGRITEQGVASSNCKLLPKDSVLIALNGQGKTRATVAILRVPAACNQSLVAMTPIRSEILAPEFLFLNLWFRYLEVRDITGQKQRRGLNMGLVSDLPISLPPLAEQHRIIAKVDELMTLCDRLEAEQKDSSNAHAKLVEILLGTLTQSIDADELTANWQRLNQHFDTLFSTESSLDALKQTIRDGQARVARPE